MKFTISKSVFMFVALILTCLSLYGQSVLADSSATDSLSLLDIQIPTVYKFENESQSFTLLTTIFIALLTIITGTWAKANVFLQQYIPTTSMRIAVVALLAAIGVNFIFGFSPTALGLLGKAVVGVLVGIGGHTVFIKKA